MLQDGRVRDSVVLPSSLGFWPDLSGSPGPRSLPIVSRFSNAVILLLETDFSSDIVSLPSVTVGLSLSVVPQDSPIYAVY